jgi:3-phosphoshikimate 1-carboxyvinyltransferase
MSASRRPHLDLAPARHARGVVRVPGSKSVSIRALLLAAQAEGRTTLRGVLKSDDTIVMTNALTALGVPIAAHDDGTTLVVDGAATFPNDEADVFVGNSGLSIRTLTAALAFAGGRYRLAGVPRMHERPIGDLVDALTALGARVAYAAAVGFPPLVIEAPAPTDEAHATERVVRVRANASSQFLTGVLQAAPALAHERDLIVEVDGTLISRPYVDLTIAMMERFGVIVREGSTNRFRIAKGSRYQSPGTFDVEGDASSASYLLAAGLLGGGPVRVDGLGGASSQGDARFVDVLIAMGADVSQDDDATEVRSPGVASGFRLRPVDADFNDMPDVAMTVAVLALFADGPSTLRNIASWRVKETDRLAAMATELRKFGATVDEGDDWLRVEPSTVVMRDARTAPVEVATYDDHRIAMCFSLATFLGGPVRIDDPDCVAKTFPDYFERFATLVGGADAPDLVPIESLVSP